MKRYLIIFLIYFSLTVSVSAEWHKASAAIMGTSINVELWQSDPAIAKRLIKMVFAEMRRIDNLMSPYKQYSELSKVNRLASQSPLRISKELFKLVKKSLYFSQISNGAFDISYASIGHLYNYRKGIIPGDKEIEEKLDTVNYKNIILNNKKRTIFFARKNMKIDLGGIAKGHAVDNAISLLRKNKVNHALVSAGGDTRIIGSKNGKPWFVGIRDPRSSDRDKSAILIPLAESAISTSGDYERFFIHNEKRYHHIITPSTGESARELQSVSILGPDSTTTDALSTTVFVLGLEKGMRLIASMNDIDAIIINKHGKIFYSPGLTSK